MHSLRSSSPAYASQCPCFIFCNQTLFNKSAKRKRRKCKQWWEPRQLISIPFLCASNKHSTNSTWKTLFQKKKEENEKCQNENCWKGWAEGERGTNFSTINDKCFVVEGENGSRVSSFVLASCNECVLASFTRKLLSCWPCYFSLRGKWVEKRQTLWIKHPRLGTPYRKIKHLLLPNKKKPNLWRDLFWDEKSLKVVFWTRKIAPVPWRIKSPLISSISSISSKTEFFFHSFTSLQTNNKTTVPEKRGSKVKKRWSW